MKIFILICKTFPLASFINSQDSTQVFTFRNIPWGSSIDYVKNMETNLLIEEGDDILIFEGSLIEEDVFIIYHFFCDQLYGGIYLFKQTNGSNIFYRRKYNQLKEMLIEKYGQPIFDKAEVTNNLYNPRDWDELMAAISLDMGSIKTTWDIFNETICMLSIMNFEDFQKSLAVGYTYLTLYDLKKKTIIENSIENL